MSLRTSRIICLSNAYDQQYHELRGEAVERCLSSSKRRDLFRCLELATTRSLVVLSVPPKSVNRRSSRWLPAATTRFSTYPQHFCAALDVPKIRIPSSWMLYAWHVLRHTRSGDLLVIDNFELVYVLAARLARTFRKVECILEYEDGKHLIDRSWWYFFSRTAELLGKPLIRAALLAHPRLGERLPKQIPTELVPGFVELRADGSRRLQSRPVRFLYSGTLDSTRGVDLLLKALSFLPAAGWHLDITGSGVLEQQVRAVAADAQLAGKVTFHGALSPAEYDELLEHCHIGLNCQRSSDPISSVTFPSKIFSYLSAGLLVLSTRASDVERICGESCRYFENEEPISIAKGIIAICGHLEEWQQQKPGVQLAGRYSVAATAQRIQALFRKSGVLT